MLNNKNVIVTGATSSIGAEIALAMARAGADIIFQYFSNEKAAQLLQESIEKLGKRAYGLKANFTIQDEINSFFSKAIKLISHVDVLVNCAAAYKTGSFLEITAEQFSWMNQVNSEAPMVLIQTFAKYCQEKSQGGSVINISSISGTMPSTNSTLNSCSKASLNMLTKCAALELAKYNIRVNAICPGLIDTESNADFKNSDPVGWKNAVAEIPLQKAGQPADCAELAVFLASDKSSWITGTIIPVDGGMTISWKS